MKEFFQKHGNTVLFVTVIVICLSFFVQVLTLGGSYSDDIYEQAAERSQFFAKEQAMLLDGLITPRKISADSFAAMADSCEDIDSLKEILSGIRAANIGESMFRDVLYAKDGKVYDRTETELTYSALSAVASSSQTVVSRVFQYENNLMSFAVFAPVKGSPVVDGILTVYYNGAVSLAQAKQAADADEKCFSLASLTLLCKHDGKVLEEIVNDEKFDFEHKGEAVQNGLLEQIVTEADKHLKLRDAIDNGESCSVNIVTGAESYIVTIQNLGKQNGGLFVLDVYALSAVFGQGYKLLNQIMGALVGLAGVMALLCIVFVVNKMVNKKLVYNLEMVNAELQCATPKKFFRDADEILYKQKTSKYALISAKINNFGYMESEFGDQAVKQLLLYERNTLQNALFPLETFGYFGEGEFYLLLNYKNRKTLEDRLRALYAYVNRSEVASECKIKVTMSFSVYEIDRKLQQTLHQMADKVHIVQHSGVLRTGSCSVEYYGDMLREDYFKKAEIESRMENALKNNEFHLFYQPKYNIKRGDMDGSEILVRWYDPKIDAYRKPGEFLPVFEENGFIDKLDRFVFFRACENVAERIQNGKRVYPVSVNISRVTAIQRDFLDYYKRIKEKFRIPDGFVTLEFTESFAYENYEYLAYIISELHKNGFLCSLDDFGTGYSSYNVLKTLDMDEIKLDKFFIAKGTSYERDQLLLGSIIEIVKKMGIKVTQEGVETREDFERLRNMGCDIIQGYYFSKPMKYVDYCEFVRKNFEK